MHHLRTVADTMEAYRNTPGRLLFHVLKHCSSAIECETGIDTAEGIAQTCMNVLSLEAHVASWSSPRGCCLKGSAMEGGIRHSARAGVGAVRIG